jgi:eukaryotic-like serine/threonine-protein kinase
LDIQPEQLIKRGSASFSDSPQSEMLLPTMKPGFPRLHRQVRALTDFGLAKLVAGESTLTRTNAVLGIPSYMAPEQARGAAKEVTTAADW